MCVHLDLGVRVRARVEVGGSEKTGVASCPLYSIYAHPGSRAPPINIIVQFNSLNYEVEGCTALTLTLPDKNICNAVV